VALLYTLTATPPHPRYRFRQARSSLDATQSLSLHGVCFTRVRAVPYIPRRIYRPDHQVQSAACTTSATMHSSFLQPMDFRAICTRRGITATLAIEHFARFSRNTAPAYQHYSVVSRSVRRTSRSSLYFSRYCWLAMQSRFSYRGDPWLQSLETPWGRILFTVCGAPAFSGSCAVDLGYSLQITALSRIVSGSKQSNGLIANGN
jgi:hypothetical protein